jgi:hypothetical protein
MEPNASTAFLFVNKSHDCLLLYSIDADGDRTVTKKLEKGTFIVPVPEADGSPVRRRLTRVQQTSVKWRRTNRYQCKGTAKSTAEGATPEIDVRPF